MINKRKQEVLGELELRSLAYVQFRKIEILKIGDLVKGIGLTQSQEFYLLSRLESKGQIIRLKRGFYFVPSQLPPSGKLSLSEYSILSKYMEVEKAEYQLSGPTMFHQYGFDEQIPNMHFVYNDRISGEKTIGGHRFVFMKTKADRLKYSSILKESSGEKVLVATKAKALVDAIYDWSRFNTLPRALSWIVAGVRKDNRLKIQLIRVVLEAGNLAAVRRIGCLLAHNGFSKSSLLKLKERLGKSKSLIPLVPRKPVRGSVDRYWGVIINDTIKY